MQFPNSFEWLPLNVDVTRAILSSYRKRVFCIEIYRAKTISEKINLNNIIARTVHFLKRKRALYSSFIVDALCACVLSGNFLKHSKLTEDV